MAKAKNRMMQGEFTPGVDPGLKAWLKMREDVRNSRLKGSNQYTITSDISYKLHYHWIDILHSLNEESFQKLIKTNQISDADLAKANHKNLCTFEEFEEFLKEENPDIEKLYYYAIQHRSLILLNVLFEREKYDVNRLLTQKRRPILHLAVIHGELEKVRFLLEHGANATICDIDNRSALHFAMQPDSSFHPLEIPSLLIQHGADVNTQDNHGRTPLHYACLIKSPNLARLLLQNGADMTIEDEKVKTPLNYNHNVRNISYHIHTSRNKNLFKIVVSHRLRC